MNENKVWKLRAAVIRPIFVAVDEKCINRSQLARKYGISRSTLYQYETGRTQVPARLIDWLIEQLGLPQNVISREMRGLIEQSSSR